MAGISSVPFGSASRAATVEAVVAANGFWKSPASFRTERRVRIVLSLALVVTVAAAARGGEAPDLQHGEKLWGKCQACHTVEPGGPNKVGPNLHGVFGRTAAGLEGYNYSEAMRRSGVVWTEETLDKFLGATQDYLPGTKMYGGLALPTDRRDLIAWLKQAASRE
jgi:cytochrome c